MTKEQIDAIPRREARQLLASIAAGPGYDDRVLLAVEQAMNLEWWRGYHAAFTWQPTSIAPKDGRTILFRRRPPFTTGVNLVFGFWHVGQNVPGWQSDGGSVIVPEHWPEWMPVDGFLPPDVIAWLHPEAATALGVTTREPSKHTEGERS